MRHLLIAAVTAMACQGSSVQQATRSIAGTVTGPAPAGVTIALSGAASAHTTTTAAGKYSFAGLADGHYTLTPSLAGWTFSPASLDVTVAGTNLNNENFSELGAYAISGAVSGVLSSGVSVALSGAATATTTTDTAGNYSFTGVASGSYTVTPSASGGITFAPASRDVTVAAASASGQDFVSAGPWSIFGAVVHAHQTGITGVDVSLNGTTHVTTGTNGGFEFDGLVDGTYTLVASLAGRSFSPASRTVTLAGGSAFGQTFIDCAPVTASGSTAVTYQIDPTHTGGQPGDTLSLPLCERWSRDLFAPVSYPLVADGRVFVTIGATPSGARTSLVALDEETGATLWGPIDLGGTYPRGGAAYDDGRVFAVNSDGKLQAFDAATGAPLWSGQLPNQYAFSAPPTATGGMVYVSGAGIGGTVYAVHGDDGGVAWASPVENGDQSSPAVTDAGVWVSYACNQTYRFDPADGGQIWHYSGPCEGGGGATVAVYDLDVFTRDSFGDLILGAADGSDGGVYQSKYIPAFSGNRMFVTSDTLQETELTGAVDWTFDAGATTISTAPIAVGPHVVVGTADGHLFVLDVADGGVVSSVPLANIRTPDEQNVSAPLAGMAAADGMLFVPAGNTIVAY